MVDTQGAGSAHPLETSGRALGGGRSPPENYAGDPTDDPVGAFTRKLR